MVMDVELKNKGVVVLYLVSELSILNPKNFCLCL